MRYRFGQFELQPDERRLLSHGAPVALGPNAFAVLVALVERGGRLATKDALLKAVWGPVVVEENTLQVHVSALRKVLGAAAIETVPGHGYRFALQASAVEPPRPAPQGVPKNNLPFDLTSFIGRDKELADLARALQRSRLVTLTGAGGCGKTRLALRLARGQLAAFPDGIRLVELAALADAALLAQALGRVLDLTERPGVPLIDAIAEYLGPRAMLLVLDNAEHLVEACAALAETLLRRCERLVIVVTSRERLAITGELVYRVPSLTVPRDEREASPASIESYEAPRLFIERVRLHIPDFELTPANAPSVASICRRLDGIALALELAAAAARTVPIEELGQRLNDRFELLTQGSRTALPRHQTLRALIDWSCQRLDDTEKAVLRRLSVFAGGWQVDAAEEVCAGAPVQGAEVRRVLASLADKSLIHVETRDGVARYAILETVREYAGEELQEHGEIGDVHRRHFGFLNSLRSDDGKVVLPPDLLKRFSSEIDNIRAALSWSLGPEGDSEAGLRLAANLHSLWLHATHTSEGRRWLSRLRAATPVVRSDAVLANTLLSQAILATTQDDYAAAQGFASEQLALGERTGDSRTSALGRATLARIAKGRGQRDRARELYLANLETWRALSDGHATAATLVTLGQIECETGDFAAARTRLEDPAAISTSWLAPFSVFWLAVADYHEGKLASAKARLLEALRIQRENRMTIRDGLVHGLLGVVAHHEGDVAGARSHLRQALVLVPDIGSPLHLCEVLEAYAALACTTHGGETAARLWGAAERGRERLECAMAPCWQAWYERCCSASRPFDAAWNEGRAMSLEQAVTHAQELAGASTSP